MKQSILIAFCIFLAIVAYFGVRTFMRGDEAQADTTPRSVIELEAEKNEGNERPSVVTQTLSAEVHPVFLTLKGRTVSYTHLTLPTICSV